MLFFFLLKMQMLASGVPVSIRAYVGKMAYSPEPWLMLCSSGVCSCLRAELGLFIVSEQRLWSWTGGMQPPRMKAEPGGSGEAGWGVLPGGCWEESPVLF